MKILVRPLVLLVMTMVFAIGSQTAEAGFFKKHFGCKKKCSKSCEEEAEPTCECAPEPACECTPEPACPTCETGTVIYAEPSPAPMPVEGDAPAPPPVDMSRTSSPRIDFRTVSHRTGSIRTVTFRR